MTQGQLTFERAYYSQKIASFLDESIDSISGKLSFSHAYRSLEERQISAWKKQIHLLKSHLKSYQGQVYFEFSIPRVGRRVDNIVIVRDTAFIIEFKVGGKSYEKDAIDQVIDYTIDLKNFHEGSHLIKLVPVLVATDAKEHNNDTAIILRHETAAKANKSNLDKVMALFLNSHAKAIDPFIWENSRYMPTPTIIEAAQALYKGHNVKEITRSDAGAVNLSKTTASINHIIEHSKATNSKSICFVTGVPGSGKTLAGLNIANERMNIAKDEHAVFLSGNGPLVKVLCEALSRDEVKTTKQLGERITKVKASNKVKAFIQNIHHFRDDNLACKKAPIEKVVVFDEAQRAWTKQQTSVFMKRKKETQKTIALMKRKKETQHFNMSEPDFLISVMNRHDDWCAIICLIGGGQEINTGEGGLEEWIVALKSYYPDWQVYYSKTIIENENYLSQKTLKNWLKYNGKCQSHLHLSVSVRSFRSEKLSGFVQHLLERQEDLAAKLYQEIREDYPIVITRNLALAKAWLKEKAKGTERIGIIASSGARRLKANGLDVKNNIVAENWFLNESKDVRSSDFLEDIATEFDIQGLEIDWACLAWGANFYYDGSNWKYQRFHGSQWQNINQAIDKVFLKNTYRVLLTRARQGIVLFIPEGSATDSTRESIFYDGTYHYFKRLGVTELTEKNDKI